MRKLKSSIAASLIVGGFLFCLCLSGIVTSRVSAESNLAAKKGNARHGDEKISETFRDQLKSITGGENGTVQVILQLNASPNGQLNALLQRNGVHLKDELKELQDG